MNTTTNDTDLELAVGLSDREEAAHSDFRGSHQSLLDRAHGVFHKAVPACKRPAHTLSPHVGYAAGRGYARLYVEVEASREEGRSGRARNLGEFLRTLTLHDLHHAAACLQWNAYPIAEIDADDCDEAEQRDRRTWDSDSEAVRHLCVLVERRVLPYLRKRYRGSHLVQETIDSLPGHIMVDGEDGEVRLTQYSGRSALTTWLTGIAVRMVTDGLRRGDRAAVGEVGCEAQLEPTVETRDTDSTRAVAFVQRFMTLIARVYAGLTDRQRLVFQLLYFRGMSPSAAAATLGVARPYVSKCIRIFRLRLAELARDVIDELAEATNVDRQVIIEELDQLLQFLRCRERDGTLRPADPLDDDLKRLLDDLSQFNEDTNDSDADGPSNANP
ncbi:RNA polymerase sigma factor [Rubinisphaera brasiliensis]|uniref:RNA polymerase sigma factor n=1 Tax=Rubinisphaera brasiliensis TaxID=119 RepID=UPI000303D9DD|nr:hypothetical protein [Rubinisphaera brasiliensis]